MNKAELIRCRNCGSDFPRLWEVYTVGPHSWLHGEVEFCPLCWTEGVRGDGRCYSGHFQDEDEAAAHAAAMSS